LHRALARSGLPTSRCAGLARELETAAWQQAARNRKEYAAIHGGLCRALPEDYGEFLEDSLAAHISSGRVTAREAVTPQVYKAHLDVSPRKRCRAQFYKILRRDPRFDSPGDAGRKTMAREIERGCYNAAINRCNESTDSYRRQWDSQMFVNVYSARCGLVSSNIDPGGSVVKSIEGGTWALDCLASKKWLPQDLGTMTATQLCPMAGKAERDKITHRLQQHIEEKTSSLFACPHCHKRNHTYRQVQIGAGDEPSTFMCTCKECGQNYEGFA